MRRLHLPLANESASPKVAAEDGVTVAEQMARVNGSVHASAGSHVGKGYAIR